MKNAHRELDPDQSRCRSAHWLSAAKTSADLRERTIMLDFDAIAEAKITRNPFQFFVTPNVLCNEALATLTASFPDIKSPGVFPLSELSFGPAFAKLIEDIRNPMLARIISERFNLDLADKPLMITVRGHCRPKDGQIHNDKKTKLVTCLLYLNDVWQDAGGRLRMLPGPRSFKDCIVEIPPNGGTFTALRRTENSWHGHESFEGERRCVMINWMSSRAALLRELARHRLSAKTKRLNRLR